MSFQKLLFAAALAVCSLGFAGTAEAAKTCKSSLTGPTVHSHPTRVTAEAAAIAVWSTRAANYHTLRFANWVNAEGKGFACSKYTTNIGINAWRCRAIARPCALN
jgi:hypothetical protein